MADNYTYTSGTSGTAAGDLIGDVMYPRVKIALGNDGTADGDVYSGRPLPVSIQNGTMTASTAVLNSGTINVSTATVTSGSIAVTAGTGIVTSGSIAITAGTMIMTAGTVAAGTIAVSAGTITHGTIDAGTVRFDGRSIQNVLSYATTFAGTAGQYGTLIGSASVGAGTSLWVNDLSIVNSAGTVTALVGFGTALNGTSVLAKGNFGPQGGIQKSYPKAVNAGMTNQDLVCYTASAGTIDVNVSYFISA